MKSHADTCSREQPRTAKNSQEQPRTAKNSQEWYTISKRLSHPQMIDRKDLTRCGWLC
ncbi:hypothetical protein VPHD490_0217 [Vibrio phage D490]